MVYDWSNAIVWLVAIPLLTSLNLPSTLSTLPYPHPSIFSTTGGSDGESESESFAGSNTDYTDEDYMSDSQTAAEAAAGTGACCVECLVYTLVVYYYDTSNLLLLPCEDI